MTTGRQLGAAIHDARVQAGLTQAALAERAGVSRKWLIGLERGARTGAELGKVLAVLNALHLSIQLIKQPERSAVQPTEPSTTLDTPKAEPLTDTPATREVGASSDAREAMEAIRLRTAPYRDILNNIRNATEIPTEILENIKRTATPQPDFIESMRQAINLANGSRKSDREDQENPQ